MTLPPGLFSRFCATAGGAHRWRPLPSFKLILIPRSLSLPFLRVWDRNFELGVVRFSHMPYFIFRGDVALKFLSFFFPCPTAIYFQAPRPPK